jgi:membrane protein insertase Oxa1/YidC/SpoIIIJ
MSIDPLEDIMDDPDKRAKLFLIFSIIRILVFTVIIPLGVILYILLKFGVI